MKRSRRSKTIFGITTLAVIVALFGGIQMVPSATPTGPADPAQVAEGHELHFQTHARIKRENIQARVGEPMNEPITSNPAPGWKGETRFGNGNDWEPSIAADPNSPYVYVLTTRFGSTLCGSCSHPSIVYRVSSDGGDTWGPTGYLCKGCDNWQYDPTIEVADDGTVYATWLTDGWHTWLQTSTDHGQTWNPRVDTRGNLAWTDHGFVTVSPDGQDVYVAYNKQGSFANASHDGGATFDGPVKMTDGTKQYFYDYNGAVLSDDTVVIAVAGVSRNPYSARRNRYYVARSTDGGATWQMVLVGSGKEQPNCYTVGCRHDHWAGLGSIAADSNDNLVYTYVASRKRAKGQLMYATTSTDEGLTWGPPERLSPTMAGNRRVIAVFPAVASGGADNFRTIWMDNRNGRHAFNTWYSESNDGGATFSPAVRISDATSGAPYKTAAGFKGDYGDYLDVDVNSAGKTVGTWGEAFGYYGPGGTWINVQT